MALLWIVVIVLAIIIFRQKGPFLKRIERLERLVIDLDTKLNDLKDLSTSTETFEAPAGPAPDEVSEIKTPEEPVFDTTQPVYGKQEDFSETADEDNERFELPTEDTDDVEDLFYVEDPYPDTADMQPIDTADSRQISEIEPTPQKPSLWIEKWQYFKANVDWEQFTGVKLFAWLAGLALFIAAGFFVKHSIDRNLIPPALRLAIGAVTGIALIISSVFLKTEKYTVMRHTLAAGGIGVLYSIVFAATLYYQYLPQTVGFALLALVSATAFVLAVYYKGLAVSVLGAIGAYATPVLVSTDQSSLEMLLIYLVVVNVGAYQVVRRIGSQILLLVTVAGTLTALTLATGEGFFKISPFTIALVWGLNLGLFTVFLWLQNQNPQERQTTHWIGMAAYFSGLIMAGALLLRSGPAPLLLIILCQIAALGLAWRNRGWYNKIIPYSAVGFAVGLIWTLTRFTASNFSLDFIFLFLYGVIGGLGPILLVYRYGSIPNMRLWFKIFPAGIVLLGAWIVFKEPHVSFWFWPMILGLELLSIAISILVRGFVQVVFLVLIFLATAIQWIFHSPPVLLGPGFFIFILLTGMIMCGGIFLLLKNLSRIQSVLDLGTKANEDKAPAISASHMEQWMAAAPAAGVFILLAASFMVSYPFYPHPGMATLICFLILVLFAVRRLHYELPGVAALVAAAIAQGVFVFHPDMGYKVLFAAITWSGALFLLAVLAPFIFFRSFHRWKKIWNAWAIFEGLQAIYFIYASQLYWADPIAHWIPLALAAFKITPVAILLRRLEGNPARNSILAFHGGILLFYFSTLPVLVLDHGWIGLSFVLEASALLWLNRRIEHPGLRWVATAIAPIGILLLLGNLPLLKSVDSLPVLNPAVLSVAVSIVSLAFAVSQASYPQRQLKALDLPNYFLWMTVGMGFFFINLIISDIFAQPGHRFSVWPGTHFLQAACYALSWVGLGSLLRCALKLPDAVRRFAILLISAGAVWMLGLPLILPHAIGQMKPLFNIILLLYLPLMAFLFYLFHKESWDDQNSIVKNLFLAFFLIAGFFIIKMESSTIFQTGYPFSLRFSYSPIKGAVSAAGWLAYGLGLMIWPKRLDWPFRLAGLILMYVGLAKALLLPFIFREDFAQMTPLINIPSLVYAVFIGVLTGLTVKSWKDTWPIPIIPPRVLWGITLAVAVFGILNIEIASVFAIKGRPFSMLTHGSLSMQLAYSIGWLLFAIGLLIVGIKWDQVKIRWAAIIAIVFTAIKIFMWDLWSLGQLYRVGSFLGLALVLGLVSLLYQWFLSKGKIHED